MTVPRRTWVLLLVPLVAAAPMRRADPDSLLRAGLAAYRAGDPGRAAELFERAGLRTTEPSRAAFNLATARYRQAREDSPQALAEAEEAYHCCLEPGDPYRAEALFGLGNCLLLRAGGATLDRAALRAAIDRFSQCLAEPGCPRRLADDARYNRARARLLLLQAPAAPGGANDDPSTTDDKDRQDDEPPDPSRGPDGNRDNGADTPQGSRGNPGERGHEQPGDAQQGNEGANAPGKGIVPPVPDSGDPMPLSPRDAELHLEKATRAILKDLQEYRRGRARTGSPGVRDW